MALQADAGKGAAACAGTAGGASAACYWPVFRTTIDQSPGFVAVARPAQGGAWPPL